MAEIKLTTRLFNRYNDSRITDATILGKGEIHFIPVEVPIGSTGETTTAVLMKVGDGESTYGSLDFVAARAADVYDWAKAPVKPTYTADEIDGLAGYIAGKVQDTNTKYTFVENEGNLVVNAVELDGSTSTVATINFVTPAELTTVLNDYVTNTTLENTIANYVTNNTFNTYKTETEKAIADAKAAGTNSNAALEEYIASNDAALADVKATADAAAVKTEVETALAGKVDSVEGKSLVADTEIARLATLVNYDDTAVKADIQTNADAIDAIEADYLKAADKTELTNAIAAEASRADAAEKANAAAIKVIADDYLTSADDYLTSADKTELANATAGVKTTADAAKAAIDAFLLDADSSEKAVDTLKEIQALLDAGDVSAADLLAEINALKAIDNATQEEFDAKVAEIEAAIAKKASNDTVNTIDGRVATLEAIDVATKDNVATAKAEAIADAATKASAAQTAAEANAAVDATAKADAALASAKADATTKADAALASAKTDATTKANAAEANAIATIKDFYKAGLGLTLAEDGTFAIDTDLVFVLDANA